jgi:hypothetical protein
MFYRAIAFNRPLGDWNVSNATTLVAMFYRLPLFNQDLSAWDTRKVTVFAYMFEQATAFKQNCGAWNVEAGANFTQMFYLGNINDTGTTANYDALLVGWAAQNVQNSKSFHAGSSKYSVGTGKPARDHLTLAIGSGGHGWTITDGGVGP